jgi:hypothetical protein
MSFEGLKEFKKNLFLGLLTAENIRVSLGRVDTLNVVNINETTSILVEFIVGLSN